MTRNLFPARLRMNHQNRRLNTNYRRNGKLQSCEPCRKGKLRCDHMMPTCGRCAKRNKPEQCVYHPAPLTKNVNSVPTPPETDESSPPFVFNAYECNTVPNDLPVPAIATGPQPRVPRASSVPVQPWSSSIYGQQTTEELRRPLNIGQTQGESISFQQSPGFVHHAAILAEHESFVGIVPQDSDPTPSQIPQSYIDKGAAVLTLLQDFALYQKYVDKWFSVARGIILIEPMVKIWTTGIWTTWHKVLEGQKPEELRRMSEKIWENTTKPLARLLNRNTTPREFCANVTGDNLRWEVIGIIMTLVNLVAQTLQDGDAIFCSHDEPPVDRAALALKTHNASEMCVGFCDEFGVINDLYLWLLYENCIAYCSMRTKGSYQNWIKFGTLATAILCCNLHEEIKVDDKTPFFIAECRKRLFVCAYDSDKWSALYVGRPPRLTRHYCQLQLPLDLTDAQTMSDGLDLEDAIASLDEDGWNPNGSVQWCTATRFFACSSLVMEEILEISLGKVSPDEIVQRAASIEQRTIQMWNELPDFLRLDEQDPWNLSKRAPIELLFLVYIRIAYHQHMFLVQRTLIKKVGADSTKLLSVCQDMFHLVMDLTNHRDVFRDFHIDYVQILCMSGIPAAAVVAVELLKQEQDAEFASAMTNPLPRSETIQNLSVFVAALASVRPESNGWPSCERGRKFLKKILDTILSPTPMAGTRSNSNIEGLEGADPCMPVFQATNDVDFMRWLETMDWEQNTPWVNFS